MIKKCDYCNTRTDVHEMKCHLNHVDWAKAIESELWDLGAPELVGADWDTAIQIIKQW